MKTLLLEWRRSSKGKTKKTQRFQANARKRYVIIFFERNYDSFSTSREITSF